MSSLSAHGSVIPGTVRRLLITHKQTSSLAQPSKTQTEEVGPSSTRCPVPLYYKCGGWDVDKPWTGCTVCVEGAKCVVQNEWYYQCVADDGS